MSGTITPQRVADAFCKTLDEIEGLRAELEEKIKPLLEKQEARYNWLRENGFPIEFLTQIYVRDRERKRLLTQEVEKVIDPLQSERESSMLLILEGNKLTKASTEFGTVFRDLKESVTVEDWDALLEHVVTTKSFNLLNKAVSKTAVTELMGDLEENKETGYKTRPHGDKIPPGVKYNAFRTVKVRKA